jgi:hypothetical protein
MSTIFSNDGEADINALITLGASVKVGENRIGYFGSGFKFAVPVLLRSNCKITIWIGADRYDFSTRLQQIRDRDFEVVVMSKNGRKPVQLGFTTQLGRNWQLWKAYRELYCNCMDEDGAVSIRATRGFKGEAGKTFVVVEGDDFERVHQERHKYILDREGRELIYSNADIEVFRGMAPGIFYRGIRVSDTDTMFTYNVLAQQTLTEDRTLAPNEMWHVDSIVRDAFLAIDKPDVVEAVVTKTENDAGKYEAKLNFDWSSRKPSETFQAAVKAARKTPNGARDSAVNMYHKQVEDPAELYEIVTLNATQQAQFDRAKRYLNAADLIPHIGKHRVIFVNCLGRRQLGEATKDLIVVNITAFDTGTKEVAATLLEEYLHVQERVRDCTRDMQTLLFATIMNVIEKATGHTI